MNEARYVMNDEMKRRLYAR